MKIIVEWWGPKSGKRYVRVLRDETQADTLCKWLNTVGIRWRAAELQKELEHLKVK